MKKRSLSVRYVLYIGGCVCAGGAGAAGGDAPPARPPRRGRGGAGGGGPDEAGAQRGSRGRPRGAHGHIYLSSLSLCFAWRRAVSLRDQWRRSACQYRFNTRRSLKVHTHTTPHYHRQHTTQRCKITTCPSRCGRSCEARLAAENKASPIAYVHRLQQSHDAAACVASAIQAHGGTCVFSWMPILLRYSPSVGSGTHLGSSRMLARRSGVRSLSRFASSASCSTSIRSFHASSM